MISEPDSGPKYTVRQDILTPDAIEWQDRSFSIGMPDKLATQTMICTMQINQEKSSG